MLAIIKFTNENVVRIQIEVYQTKSAITVRSQGDTFLDV